jgi:hypothetical protein
VEENRYIALGFLTPLLDTVDSERYALAVLSLLEDPRCQWVGSFDGSRAYLYNVEENRYIALGSLTPLLGRGE